MLILTRPRSGRIVTGVALGISELYGIPVSLLRIAWVAAFIASPLSVLLYLLLSISMPNEAGVAGILSVEGLDTFTTPRDRFTKFSTVLVNRLISAQSHERVPSTFVQLALLGILVILELPKIEGARYYYFHPFISLIVSSLTRIATPLFYAAIAALFLWMRPRRSIIVSIDLPLTEKLSTDNSARKMIGGVAAGIASVIRIDPAYIRVILLTLNILTFGIAGVIYFIIQFLLRRKGTLDVVARFPRPVEEPVGGFVQQKAVETMPEQKQNFTFYRIVIAFLFVALAAIRISTEFRFYFFNESFAQGIAIAMAGIIFAVCSTKLRSNRLNVNLRSISLLIGSAMFFAGIYFLAMAIGRVQVTFTRNVEIGELVAALSLAYFGVVALTGKSLRVVSFISIVIALCAVSIGLNFAPVHDLTSAGRFYDFFYPVIYGVLAIWIAFEK